MNMEDFHCDSYDLRLKFSPEEFDKTAFLKVAGIEDESEYLDEDGEFVLRLSFGSRAKQPKDHAHLQLLIRKDQSGVATLSYHQAGANPVDKSPPNLEDCANWLGSFFKKDEMEMLVNVAYEFGDEFVSTIPLPFPLVASNKALIGLKVTGLSLQYPEDDPIESVILQRSKKEIYLFFHTKAAIRLKEFSLFTELENLNLRVSSLVTAQEKINGRNKKTKKT